eukprot:2395639-Prymnesium_polylepis.2
MVSMGKTATCSAMPASDPAVMCVMSDSPGAIAGLRAAPFQLSSMAFEARWSAQPQSSPRCHASGLVCQSTARPVHAVCFDTHTLMLCELQDAAVLTCVLCPFTLAVVVNYIAGGASEDGCEAGRLEGV